MRSIIDGTAVLTVIAAMCGCVGQEPALTAPALDPAAAGRLALEAYDKDADGKLSSAELQPSPALNAALTGLDTDKDGHLSSEEIAARVAAYRDSRVALMSMPCQITLDGKPLAGADVTLTPETFMGSAVKPATGKTDEGGRCNFRIEGEELPGVNPGMYRISISKKDGSGRELVPARYNSSTVLGHDMGAGSATMPELGLTLHLTSQ